MGTGDYICVTLRGGAPWGFTLREGEGDFYRPFLVSQVEEGGRAFLAGVQDGDEVVSLNGEPCADLTLLRAHALIESSIDCLQLLVKRDCSNTSENLESEEAYGGDALMSTTLHILSPKQEPQSPRELFFTGSHDGGYYRGGPPLHAPSSDDQDPAFKETDNEVQRCFSPGVMVEVQLSLSKQTLGCTSLGSAHGIEGELSKREESDTIRPPAASHDAPCSAREPFGQRGVVLGSPSMMQQVEVTLKQPAASAAGRGILSVEGGAGGPGVSESGGSQSGGEEEGGGGGGGHGEEVPGTFSVSFRIPSEEATQAEEQDSDSEGDPDKPNKHRARHARLRRSESQSEKQVKEAKSKCKRIALLLTAAPPNPNNKGVLMFKKHRQRAKKYTLVSYGTGEDGQEYSGEEDDEDPDEKQGIHAVEFTLAARNLSELDKHFLTDAHNSKGVLTINWDKGLLEIERNLINQEQMECLPDTKGKGALMFAQRRLRMDEISAEHEELRSQGIPVEGMQEAVKDKVEPSYMQSTTEDQAYMDVNIHQQSQQQQQHQQYQEQQYYEQQQHYQQQQQYQQQYQQQQQLQQYEQQHYQQQQQHMYQQQQEYHQQQQQIQQYSVNNNGTVQHQTNEMQSSFSNRTAKPFSAESVPAAPYYPAMSGADQDSMGQGEQIASRDERISTPASRTGLLDSKGRNIGKPMFTFKDAPKVSPNPALLNLLNRSDKKLVFESGPEEDYLSLGAEACNFLQSSRIKHKNPPPVAPKPMINPNTAPWSAQIEVPNQDMPQHAENSVSTSAVAPTIETTPSAELEPAPAPAPEPSPLQAPIEAPASTTTEEQHKWTPAVPETQQQQVIVQGENGQLNASPQPETAPMRTWAPAQPQAQQEPSPVSWHPAQVQPQVTPQSQSPPQPPWVTRQPPPSQVQTQPQTNNWTPQVQSSWIQPQEQAQAQTHAQQSWAQPQAQAQVQPPWIHTNEPHMQQMQPNRGQPQELMPQQSQASWAQPPQADPNHQPPWVQQTQQKSQTQPPWVQQSQPETQPQPPWAQPSQYQAPQQAWPQAQASGQPQPQWDSAQPQLQQQQQPSINAWPPTQTQAQPQPPWIQTPQAQPPTQPTANLNPWAPVPAQAQSQPSWAQQPPEHGQQPMNSWGAGQSQAQQPQPWVQPVPPQPTPQPNWQQAPPQAPPQPTMGTWSPAQTPPQPPANAWVPQSHQSPVNTAPSMNTQPSPKPWHPPQNASQNRSPPPPPQRTNSYHYSQRTSPLINPMATVLNPSSAGSAYEMPAVKGKGADMFAKRQSRMEKYVVDSETVQANKASRSTSPAPSLPNEWKYTPNALGRSYSLSPPARVTSKGRQSGSCSPRPQPRVSGQTPWLEKVHKPLTPWEAASRHPLGLVDEAFAFQNLQQNLASNVHLAAQRKRLPEPPPEWKARVSYQAPPKTGSQTWSRAPLPSFVSPTKSAVPNAPRDVHYGSLPRQWQPHRPPTGATSGPSPSSFEHKRPLGKQTYKPVYGTNTTWSWRR